MSTRERQRKDVTPPTAFPDFVCPSCRSGLLNAGRELQCSECAKTYPIENGIPRFVPADNYSKSFGLQWNRHRRTQFDSVIGKPISEERLFHSTGWPRDLRGKRVLEAGSGAGRFTEVLVRTGADVYSFDYSSAIDANARSNGAAVNLRLFQADIRQVPLPEGWFDHVICLGVLQHTPDPEASFKSLARHVRPGGDLVVDMYRLSVAAVLHWKYVLRPITRQMEAEKLYRFVAWAVPKLVAPTRWLRRIGGRAGARLSPIVEYSHLGLTAEQNIEWAVLDTFDMYSPAHDHPKSATSIRAWFADVGFTHVEVFDGANGIVGRGRRPATRP